MKNSKDFNQSALTRSELAKIKAGGGVNCNTIWVECDPNCGHFTASYSTYVSCIEGYTSQCSPLEGWGQVCGNYN